MINSVIILGRLTSNPELRISKNGKKVLTIAVAVERKYLQNSERLTDFFNVVAWEKIADFIYSYFRKGSIIAIQGNLQTRTYEDKQGNKRKAVEIIAENVSLGNEMKKESSATECDTSDYVDIPDLPY